MPLRAVPIIMEVIMSKATYEKLRAMRLPAMAESYQQVLEDPKMQALAFTELMAMLVDNEWAARTSNRLKRLIVNAHFEQPNAHIADIDYSPHRELNRDLVMQLASCEYLEKARNIVLMGATGTGKSYLACALGLEACKRSYSVRFIRMPELLEEIYWAKEAGKMPKLYKDLDKKDLLIIDDWMLIKLSEEESASLLEVIHRRHNKKSTIFCSQFAPAGWHQRISEETLADAILDRIVYNAYQIHLKSSEDSPSMRKKYGLNT